MILNVSIMIIVLVFFIVASLQAKKSPDELAKMFGFYILCTSGVVLLALFWGANLEALLTLRLVSKSGVAVGIMYGCVFGTGIACAISFIRLVKESDK